MGGGEGVVENVETRPEMEWWTQGGGREKRRWRERGRKEGCWTQGKKVDKAEKKVKERRGVGGGGREGGRGTAVVLQRSWLTSPLHPLPLASAAQP